jgi:hypothetical protein
MNQAKQNRSAKSKALTALDCMQERCNLVGGGRTILRREKWIVTNQSFQLLYQASKGCQLFRKRHRWRKVRLVSVRGRIRSFIHIESDPLEDTPLEAQQFENAPAISPGNILAAHSTHHPEERGLLRGSVDTISRAYWPRGVTGPNFVAVQPFHEQYCPCGARGRGRPLPGAIEDLRPVFARVHHKEIRSTGWSVLRCLDYEERFTHLFGKRLTLRRNSVKVPISNYNPQIKVTPHVVPGSSCRSVQPYSKNTLIGFEQSHRGREE